MKTKRFTGEVLAGHKEAAIEVPFDPRDTWGISPVAIRPGRRGYPITVTVKSTKVESFVVARSRKHWLLLDERAMRAIGARRGDVISVTIAPRASA